MVRTLTLVFMALALPAAASSDPPAEKPPAGSASPADQILAPLESGNYSQMLIGTSPTMCSQRSGLGCSWP